MANRTVSDMVASIQATLEKNGFPTNRVSLPLERLYESAHQNGLNFNKVLEELKENGVAHEKTSEKIIFLPASKVDPLPGGLFDQLKNIDFSKMNMAEMMSQASTLMSQMDPGQLQKIREIYENLSPEERSKILDMAKSHGK
jgi:hypothetical protein